MFVFVFVCLFVILDILIGKWLLNFVIGGPSRHFKYEIPTKYGKTMES